MKRKASFLEESVDGPDWPSLDYYNYSSSASTVSPDSVKAVAGNERTDTHWNVGRIPYANTRTRKRHRDGRPNEETVHQNTLAKLFNAQKQLQREENRGDHWSMQSPPVSPLTQCHPHAHAYGTTLQDPSSINVWQPQMQMADLGPPERNQRSIDSFFGRGSRVSIQTRKCQTPFFQFSTMQDTSPPVVSRCEDCSAALQTDALNAERDAMAMDVDARLDDWACASCWRRVCDLCAVRGDQRICLECAVPGGG